MEARSSPAAGPSGGSFDPSEDLFRATHPPARQTSFFRYAKALFLLGGSAAGFAVAALGFCLLFGLFTLRMLAPAADQYSTELFFDFTKPLAVATAHLQSGVALMPDHQGKAAQLSARVLPAGRRFDAWLELQVPDNSEHTNGDVFQVTGRLLTADDQLAASVTRPWLLPYRSPMSQRLRSLWGAPFGLVGLHSTHTLRMQLFHSQQESLPEPFVKFQAGLQARANGGSLPRVQKAKVIVKLHLGWILRALYMVRPGRVLTLVLATAGLTGVGLGSTACLTLLLTWLFVGTAPPAASPGLKGRELGDDVLSSEELDSNAELDSDDLHSEASSQAGEHALDRLDEMPASPAGDKPWQREQGKDEALAQGTAIGVPVHDLHGLHQRGPAQKKLS